MYGFGKDCLSLIPFRLPQISCFTLSLNCFSSHPYNCPNVGTRPLLQFPHTLRADPLLLKLVFPPSSFILLSFALFYYSFPLASYSCLLSAGVLHALLCLKVYSWCVCGERCTPHPPTPLPSCSSNVRQFFKEDILMYHEFFNKNSICGNSLWLRYVSEVGRVEVRAEAAPWEATMFGQRARAHGVQGHFSQSP